jgi:hypothetical protein
MVLRATAPHCTSNSGPKNLLPVVAPQFPAFLTEIKIYSNQIMALIVILISIMALIDIK